MWASGRLQNLSFATGRPSFEMSRSFRDQVAFTCGKESAACETHAYLFPKRFDEKVAVLHLPALGAVLTFFAKEHAVHVRVKVEGYRN